MGEEYAAASRGTLKLKGVASGRVDKPKHKKKKKLRPKDDADAAVGESADASSKDEKRREVVDDETEHDAAAGDEPVDGADGEDSAGPGKTEAQLRHEAHRRRQLDERLKREGVKTHKERVEELNRYLSGLSEHHDMPRIGPG